MENRLLKLVHIVLFVTLAALILSTSASAKTRKSVNLPFCFFCFGVSDTLDDREPLEQSEFFLELINESPSAGKTAYLANYKNSYWFILGVWATSETVIHISGDSYMSIPIGEELKLLQQLEFLPEQIPDYGLSFIDYLLGYSLWLFGGVVLLVVLVFGKTNARNETTESENVSEDEIKKLVDDQLLSVLCFMAKETDTVTEEEVLMIESVYNQFSGNSLSTDEVREHIHKSTEGKHEILSKLNAVSEILNLEGRALIARATLMVAISDGEFDGNEQESFREIVGALNIGESKLDEILADFLENDGGSSPALT